MKIKNQLFILFLLLIAPNIKIIAHASKQHGNLLIKFETLEEINEFASINGLEIIEVVDEINIMLVNYPEAYSDEVKDLLLGKGVNYIEPNNIVTLPGDEHYSKFTKGEVTSFTNDPFWTSDPSTSLGQWNMRILDLEKAWLIEKGSKSVIISVVDTGLAYDHPEISYNYLPGGYNWVENNDSPYDDNGHGSWVSGVIMAKSDNEIGVAGMADVSIMAEKVLDSRGGGSISDLIQGIIHAADSGADIINLSLGTDTYSQALKDAVDYASSKGCLLIAAAGNRHSKTPHYPAAFENVIAVTATYGEPDDGIAPYSNYGGWVNISAPGGWDQNGNYFPDVGEYWVLSISEEQDTYMYGTGTSASVPHVTGTAALCLSLYPNSSDQDLIDMLINSAEDKGVPGWDEYYGHGRVSPEKALLINTLQPVGGEAAVIEVNIETIYPESTTSFIMFISILLLIMATIFYGDAFCSIGKEKIELYKRMKTSIRSN
jgi:subtilisin family serine protease